MTMHCDNSGLRPPARACVERRHAERCVGDRREQFVHRRPPVNVGDEGGEFSSRSQSARKSTLSAGRQTLTHQSEQQNTSPETKEPIDLNL
jgi:hypothetical protein